MKLKNTTKYLNFIILLCLFLAFSCSKNTQTQEQINPAGRSDYSTAITTRDATTWVSADSQKRRIGVAESSGSMLRVFDSKSVLLLESVGPNDQINIGDILGYKNVALSTTAEISHRLIRINSDGTLVLKGDNNSAEDPPVARNTISWRVVGILYTNGQ